ncbi:MAG: RidA family protein [Clostridiales bacterium]|nr:RidA family protein [Clostridiales bacterium]
MKTVISTPNAPGAIGPYSQAVKVGALLFLSGQLGIDPATGAITGGVAAQTKQALTNAKAILEAAGSTMDKVVKTTVFLSDIGNFAAMNEVYGTFFTAGSYPARSAFEVAALPKGALVEIELVAEA